MRDNVPEPFSPADDKTPTPLLNVANACNEQQMKFLANDMQEVLHSNGTLQHLCFSKG